jgi:hypothetical protein
MIFVAALKTKRDVQLRAALGAAVYAWLNRANHIVYKLQLNAILHGDTHRLALVDYEAAGAA